MYEGVPEVAEDTPGKRARTAEEDEREEEEALDYRFEPAADELLGALLPLYLQTLVLSAFLETAFYPKISVSFIPTDAFDWESETVSTFRLRATDRHLFTGDGGVGVDGHRVPGLERPKRDRTGVGATSDEGQSSENGQCDVESHAET